jgi:hypothetical protein
MPYLGIIAVKHNVLAVRFCEDTVNDVRLNPNKLSMTKKHVNLSSEIHSLNGTSCKLTELPEVEKNMKLLRPNT